MTGGGEDFVRSPVLRAARVRWGELANQCAGVGSSEVECVVDGVVVADLRPSEQLSFGGHVPASRSEVGACGGVDSESHGERWP